MFNRFQLLVLLLFSQSIFSAESKYFVIKPEHSRIDFSAKYLKFNTVKGFFSEFKGRFKGTHKTNTLEVKDLELSIKVDSINTRNRLRDAHLLKQDFFNEENYPFIYFKANDFKIKKGNETKIRGKLSIKEQNKDILLSLIYHGTQIDPWGKKSHLFQFKGSINRKDYNLNWNPIAEGGALVGDEILIYGDFQSQVINDQTGWSKHYIPQTKGKIESDEITKDAKVKVSFNSSKKTFDTSSKRFESSERKANDRDFPIIPFVLVSSFGFIGTISFGFFIKKKFQDKREALGDLILILGVIAFSYGLYQVQQFLTQTTS